MRSPDARRRSAARAGGPVTLADRPRLRLATLCALYVAQGIPYGFCAHTLTAWLAARGSTTEALSAMLAMITIPWSFKWVWGPILDRSPFLQMGRRRPWILAAQAGMIATIALMALIPDPAAELQRFAYLILVHNVFSAMQDVSVDALAVDLLGERERGRANGLMNGSKYAGTLLGGGVLGEVVGAAGLRAAFAAQVALLAAIMLFPLLLRERAGERLLPWSRGADAAPPSRGAVSSLGELFSALARAFKLRSPAVAAALALTEAIATMGITAIATVLLVQRLGWTREETTRLTGGAGVIVGLVGAVVGGFLADLVGARRLIAAACALLAVDWIGFALLEPLWSHRPLVTGCVLAAAFFAAILEIALLSLFMAVSWPRVAATQFTAYMALINLSNTIGIGSAGILEAHIGTRGVFLAAGLFQCALPLLLLFIDPGQTRRELGE